MNQNDVQPNFAWWTLLAPYKLDESVHHFRGVRSIHYFINFIDIAMQTVKTLIRRLVPWACTVFLDTHKWNKLGVQVVHR